MKVRVTERQVKQKVKKVEEEVLSQFKPLAHSC